MRILVDIPDADLKALSELSQDRQAPRTTLVRQAVREYLARNPLGSPEDAFGLWRGDGPDGLDHQRRLRSEW